MHRLATPLQLFWSECGNGRTAREQRLACGCAVIACGALCLNLATVQFALLVAALALGVAALRDPRELWQRAVAPAAPILLAVGGLFGAIVLSHCATPVGATDLGFAWRAVAWLGLVPLALALAAAGPRGRALALWALLLGATAAALLGIAQHLWGIHPGAEVLGIPRDRWQLPAPGDPERFTAVGFFYNHTRFGHVLAVALAFATGSALSLRSLRGRLLASGLAVIMLTAFLFSYTRAALAAFALALVALLVFERRRLGRSARWALVGAMVTLSAAVLLVPSLRDRVFSAVSVVANDDRQFIWRRALEIAGDFGATGIGFGEYRLAHNFYYDRVDSAFPMRSQGHNLYLTFLVEMGPVGLLALLGFLIVVVRRSRRACDGGGEDLAVRRGALLATVTMAVISLFHDPVYQAIEALAFFLGPALLAALGEPAPISTAAQRATPEVAPGYQRALAVLAWLVACAMLGLSSGPALAVIALLAASALVWSVRAPVAQTAAAAIGAVGLASLALVVPRDVAVALLAVAAVLLLAIDRRWFGRWLLGSTVIALPMLLARSGGRGLPPTWDGLLHLVCVIALAALAFALARRSVAPAGWWRLSGAIAIAAAVAGRAVVAAQGAPLQLVPAPRYSTAAFELARVGERERAAALLREQLCDKLVDGARYRAVHLSWWGVLLAPQHFATPEARLWRSELILAIGDARQAHEIALRAMAGSSDQVVTSAARLREVAYQTQLASWAEQHGRSTLAEALREAIQAPGPASGFSDCQQPR